MSGRCELCRRGQHVGCWDALNPPGRTPLAVTGACCCGAWSEADVRRPEPLARTLRRVVGQVAAPLRRPA